MSVSHEDPRRRLHAFFVLAAATVVAAVSARGYAGGWNDGSRLATVECLIDHNTLAIDDSVFVRPPPPPARSGPKALLPYPASEPHLLLYGTRDKLLIGGHYYSDKSPVPALLMAGLYAPWKAATGWTARERPDRFCWWMTFASAGLAYVAAVGCVHALGRPLRLTVGLQLLLTGSFGLATVALPYARHVNNHILLLAVASALMVGLARLAEARAAGRMPWGWMVALGSLAGLGYTIDLGAGPPLAACTLALVAYRCRRTGPVACFVAAALPWLALHHAVNYAVGGTFKPANAVPAYFRWPDSPFNAQNMTGLWNHDGVGHFLTYAAALLAGKRGFLGHNLALWLALPAAILLLRRRVAELPEVLLAAGWCGGTWLVYAVTSTNYAGQCCSVRWFVPFLAAGYFVLTVFLRAEPRFRGDFAVLSAWGAILAALMWVKGPWMQHLVPFFWPVQGAALASWAAWRWRRSRRERGSDGGAARPLRAAA